MPLLELWASNPDTVSKMTIEQIVSTAGDGALKDNSEGSNELREYLSQIFTKKLAEYIDHCLSKSFSNGPLALQDLVNELGRRLDYNVTNGRYRGVQNEIGNDGLWKAPDDHFLVIEVKTTDAYRMSLDTLAKYRNDLIEEEKITSRSSILIVVGRKETGELESQIRGSRHAWDVRLISTDALIKLVNLKESTEAVDTGQKIRSVLVPMEYTKLDELIDVMFTTVKDVESSSEEEAGITDALQDENKGGESDEKKWEFTDSTILQNRRELIVQAIARQEKTSLIKKTRATYWSSDQKIRVVCTVSKRYTKKGTTPYWYAYHPQWDQFLGEGEDGFFALGCMDMDSAFAIPVQVMRDHLEELNTTTRADNSQTYWHVKILEPSPNKFELQLPKSGSSLPLDEFSITL